MHFRSKTPFKLLKSAKAKAKKNHSRRYPDHFSSFIPLESTIRVTPYSSTAPIQTMTSRPRKRPKNHSFSFIRVVVTAYCQIRFCLNILFRCYKKLPLLLLHSYVSASYVYVGHVHEGLFLELHLDTQMVFPQTLSFVSCVHVRV